MGWDFVRRVVCLIKVVGEAMTAVEKKSLASHNVGKRLGVLRLCKVGLQWTHAGVGLSLELAVRAVDGHRHKEIPSGVPH